MGNLSHTRTRVEADQCSPTHVRGPRTLEVSAVENQAKLGGRKRLPAVPLIPGRLLIRLFENHEALYRILPAFDVTGTDLRLEKLRHMGHHHRHRAPGKARLLEFGGPPCCGGSADLCDANGRRNG